jgi:methionyl-tRNA synthetase
MDQIKYEDFAKLDLRVAIITSVQPVEGADKLLLLKLDDGTPEGRQIMAGIKKQFPSEEAWATLVGERIIIVANLEPRKMRGIESQGMLLAASEDDDLQLLTTRHYIKAGSKVG